MIHASMRRLDESARQTWCSLGLCRRPATCIGKRGGLEAAYCEECAAAVCRLNKIVMPLALAPPSVAATQSQLAINLDAGAWPPEYVK